MNEIPIHAGRIVHICAAIYTRRWVFITLTLTIFLVTAFLLALSGIIPDAHYVEDPDTAVAPAITLASISPAQAYVLPPKVHAENPIKIVMPSIHTSASVENPDTRNANILDKALLVGAVRYWRSAKLGERGNVILFGHSSYLPGIYNHAYKTFDGIQNFRKGARILVYSSTTVYEYAVYTVKKQNTTTDAINLLVQGKELTLVTCNVFGKRSDRFVVTAHFVKSYPIGNNS